MRLKHCRGNRIAILIAAIVWLCTSPTVGLTGEMTAVKDDTERISYSLGYQIGGDFKKQGVTLSREALLKGIEDAQNESATPMMPAEEMRATLIDLKKRVIAEQDRQRAASAERYRGESREFLAANAAKEGVVTLPSGLQYKVLTEGRGRHPTLDDTVTVSYRGTLIDGSEFDSSLRSGKPMSIALNSVIAGWKEALPLMQEGAKWQLFIPADLAFGERGPLADRTVIYDIELHAIEP